MGKRNIKKKVPSSGYLCIKVIVKKLNVPTAILSEPVIHTEWRHYSKDAVSLSDGI